VAFILYIFFFQAEDGIRDLTVTGVQTCALPISARLGAGSFDRRAGGRVTVGERIAVGITGADVHGNSVSRARINGSRIHGTSCNRGMIRRRRRTRNSPAVHKTSRRTEIVLAGVAADARTGEGSHVVIELSDAPGA